MMTRKFARPTPSPGHLLQDKSALSALFMGLVAGWWVQEGCDGGWRADTAEDYIGEQPLGWLGRGLAILG